MFATNADSPPVGSRPILYIAGPITSWRGTSVARARLKRRSTRRFLDTFWSIRERRTTIAKNAVGPFIHSGNCRRTRDGFTLNVVFIAEWWCHIILSNFYLLSVSVIRDPATRKTITVVSGREPVERSK